MPAELRVFADADELGEALADEVLARYAAGGGPFLLGCPGGRSLLTTYRAIARRRPRLDRLVVVMMDEYAGAPPDAHYSCRGFAARELAGKGSADAAGGAGDDADHVAQRPGHGTESSHR